MRSLSFIALSFLSAISLQAQTATEPNEGCRIAEDASTGAYTLSWWGKSARTYFIQHSDDLVTWTYWPVIESGAAAVTEYGFTSSAPRSFLRLRCSDAPTNGNPDTADFDGDGLTNLQEIDVTGTHTDPLVADTDGDSFGDGVEVQLGADPKNGASSPLTLGQAMLTALSGLIANYQAALATGNYDEQVAAYVEVVEAQASLQAILDLFHDLLPDSPLMDPVAQPLAELPEQQPPAGDPGKAFFKVWQIDGRIGTDSPGDNTSAQVLVNGDLFAETEVADGGYPVNWQLKRSNFEEQAPPWVQSTIGNAINLILLDSSSGFTYEWGGEEEIIGPLGKVAVNPGGEEPPDGVGDGTLWAFEQYHDLATIEVEHPAPYDREYECLMFHEPQYLSYLGLGERKCVGTVKFKVAKGRTTPTIQFSGAISSSMCRVRSQRFVEMGPGSSSPSAYYPWGIDPIRNPSNPAEFLLDPYVPAFDLWGLVPIEVVIPDDEITTPVPYTLASATEVTSAIIDPADVPSESSPTSSAPGQPILDGAVKAATELKIAKIEGTVDQNNTVTKAALPANGQFDINNDPDRFRIRIRGVGESIGDPKIWIATEGATIASHNDPETRITMKKHPLDASEYTTDWQLLVSDPVIDDKYAVGGIADEAWDDSTHVAELGSTVVIKRIALDFGTTPSQEIEVNLKVPVRVKRTVKVKSAVMADTHYNAAGVRDNDIKIANERLAQVGIKLELVDNRDSVPLPTGITTTVGIEAGASNGSGLTVNPKLLTLINGVHGTPTQAPNVIQITYVNSMTYPSGIAAHQDISGLALFPYYAGGGGGGGASPPVPNYANNIFISTRHRKLFTVAHEIVHLLTNAGHYGPGQSYGLQAPAYLVDHNLMKFGTSPADGFTATKRVYQGQQGMIESPNNPNSTGL